MKDLREQYEEQGCAVIENFLSEAEVNEIRSECERLIKNMPKDTERTVYNAATNAFAAADSSVKIDKDQYFMDSGDKIGYFFETGALGQKGELTVDERYSLNKIAHSLHQYSPVFKKFTFDKRVKETCRQLGFEEPAVVQSMVIFKNPSIGSEVIAHQDASYVHTDPIKLVGLWIALDDATLENGCLWYIKGSHKQGLKRRFIRNPDKNSKERLIYDKPNPEYQMSEFTPVPVKKGDCVLIHGEVVHYSAPNKSNKSRHAFTFHLIDRKGTKYSEDNWLQLPKGKNFMGVYEN